jgi:hypothetical protein
MKRIVFLDVDGVLNSYQTGFGGFLLETDTPTHQNISWGQILVNNLKYIVEKTGAEIVISSTWRLHFSIDRFKEMFALYEWPDAPIIDKTIDLDYLRGLEVNEWLSRHEVSSYVILDDMEQFLPEQQVRFVQTSISKGLTKANAKKAVEILSKSII